MNAEEIFHAAVARPPSERPALVAAACAGDERLQRRVEALLHAHENPASFLAGRPPAMAATIDQPVGERLGTMVGLYKLLEEIGEGGFGLVFLAEQTEPVRRKVALKILRPGMDSKGVLARFEAERQALALMDHPNIAKVHDAGATADGRPYFVMELVKGVPITQYCDDHHLTPRERLELFVPVCQAIQHAHQKGVIHRDIKPSNVLVALYDDRPVPKVIDFGVAKATGQALTEQTLHTGFGAVVGTVEYMSPEQASFNQLDVDTRSDVYSLGVLLYELLAGSPPFTRQDLEKAGVLEMLRVIREREPSKPSTKLSTADGLPTLAANRGTEPRRLTALVRGELDWLVMKALEKDRSRRYETANAFAADVQRYLAGEAVLAVPPSAGYRVRKFVRRNRKVVLAGALLMLVLVAGTIGTTLGFVQAVAERNEKEKAADAERAAKELAQTRLGQVEKANDILTSLFQKLNPHQVRNQEGLRVQLARHVDEAARLLSGELIGDPLVVARLQHRLGLSQAHLGYPKRAIELLGRAGEARKTHLGPDNPDTLNTLHCLAEAYEADGQREAALKLHEQVTERRRATLGPDHVDTLTSSNCLAAVYQDSGQLNKALPLLEYAYERLKRDPGPIPGLLPVVMSNLARAYWADGHLEAKAVPLLEAALEKMKAQQGADHPDTLGVMNNLAVAYNVTNRPKEALPLLEQILATVRTELGPDHPDTLTCMDNLAMAYRDDGQLDKAVPLFEQALARRRVKFPADHPDTLSDIQHLAAGYEAQTQFVKAEPLRREAVEKTRKRHGEASPPAAAALATLGVNLLRQRKWADAEAVFRDCLAIRERKQPDDWTTFSTKSQLGIALLRQEKYTDAEPLLRSGFEGMKQREAKLPAPGKARRLAAAVEPLVELHDARGNRDQANEWRKKLEAYRDAEKQPVKPKEK